MFEKASRMKLRFQYRGLLSAEDLWDLGVEDLDAIYAALFKTRKREEGESLLKKPSADGALALSLEIVKHIFDAKTEEAKARAAAAEKRVKAARIRELIARKQDEALSEKSSDELLALLSELE
jgi:hypothetical protein